MKLGKEHQMPMAHCFACGHRLDGATAVGHNDGPSPGDGSICVNCGYLMIFTDTLELRAATVDEIIEASKSPKVQIMQKARSMVRKKR